MYHTVEQTEEAVNKLNEEGFPIKHVSVVTQSLASSKGLHGFITTDSDVTKRSVVTGAWVGGLFSMLVGAAFLWVPGFGPLLVAGRLAVLLLAAVEGALAGVAAGGVLGALVNWGIAEEHILDYEKALQGGTYLLIVHGTAEEMAQAYRILQDATEGKLHIHTGTRV
jgi:hypothetical protein